jgi:hypothetical protein
MGMVKQMVNPRSQAFWDVLPPCDHSVQIYSDEVSFMDALEGYVSTGLRTGESVVLISTAAHLHELEKRLRGHWIDIDRARWEDRYIALLAPEVMARFMVDGMPDEARFNAVAGELLKRARVGDRKVRAFGEMVAILWAEGNFAAAIALENLWNKVQAVERFPLFCAYPRSGFSGDDTTSLQSVCSTHSRVIPGSRTAQSA